MEKIKDRLKKTFLYKPLRYMKEWIVYVFYPFGYIRNYLLFPIAGFMRINHIGYEYKKFKYIEGLKDIHKGKRCFIIATGPSLKVEDVNRLDGEITIAVNSFYKIYEKTSFRPTYYAVLDPDGQDALINNYTGDLSSLAKNNVFMNSIKKVNRGGVSYLPVNYQNHWFNIFNPKFDYEKNLKFTNNLLWGIYDKYTITNCAIDIAIYMGCTEIYLLGVDCNYSGPVQYFAKPNAGEFSHNEMQALLTQKAMMTGYRFMEQETKKRGIKIYNATRGGMLEEFERVDFEEALAR